MLNLLSDDLKRIVLKYLSVQELFNLRYLNKKYDHLIYSSPWPDHIFSPKSNISRDQFEMLNCKLGFKNWNLFHCLKIDNLDSSIVKYRNIKGYHKIEDFMKLPYCQKYSQDFVATLLFTLHHSIYYSIYPVHPLTDYGKNPELFFVIDSPGWIYLFCIDEKNRMKPEINSFDFIAGDLQEHFELAGFDCQIKNVKKISTQDICLPYFDSQLQRYPFYYQISIYIPQLDTNYN